MFPPIGRMEDRNLVGLCYLDVVLAEDVLSVPAELSGNIATDITLRPGKSWSRVYLDDDGGKFTEAWKLLNGQQYADALISGAIAKDRLELMPKLWAMKGKRYLVLFTSANHDHYLMGRPETPAIALVTTRQSGDQDQMESDRNEYRITFSLALRRPTPFYLATMPVPGAPGGTCPTMEQLINAANASTVADTFDEEMSEEVLLILMATHTWEELEGLLTEEQYEAAVASLGGEACATMCELIDAAFASSAGGGGDAVMQLTVGADTDDLPVSGTTNGRTHYTNPTWGPFMNYAECYWGGANWVCTDGSTYWTSAEDVATPDLVVTWSGAGPLPVLALVGEGGGEDTGAQSVVDCWNPEQLERVQALICEVEDPDPGSVSSAASSPLFTAAVAAGVDVVLAPVRVTKGDGSTQDIEYRPNTTSSVYTEHNSIEFPFAAGDAETVAVTIRSGYGGTFTALTSDGSSGTLTFSKNGGSFAAIGAGITLAATDTIRAKRTTTTGAGWINIAT